MLITGGNYHFHTREMMFFEEREQLNARFLVGGKDEAYYGQRPRSRRRRG
jgi:general stress protein 26